MPADPTPAGETTLDAFHVLGSVKRLRGWPLRLITETDAFLRVLQANQDGLITYRIEASPSAEIEQCCVLWPGGG